MSTYHVAGMKCGGCAVSVEQAVREAVPGAQVSVDVDSGRVTVDAELAPAELSAKVEEAVETAGFAFGGAA
ncbi:heavy-metal-associated domain-containing protein [Roseospirillum parvum]|uniref:Copper chaperone n=1 Tax=Roseospirillum parvum TaxID=83401 RepID=A0A1G7UBE6_9PROT|nr:heavy-metal-associated domain-containing protein [Roseospirillum parvum]SDG44080.1 copper chaperone [Roseospirillum parvum]